MKPLSRLLYPVIALIPFLSLACPEQNSGRDRESITCCDGQKPDRVQGPIHVRFGMPSPAKTNVANRENFLIERPQYVLSYHAEKRTPNWVSWCLRHDDIGNAKRGAFEPDPLLPPGFAKVTTRVYNESGFDRGHMCPAQDRSSKQEDMDATFFLTNVLPQSPNTNRHAWEQLEIYCRDLTKQGQVLHICCGPSGVGGTGSNGLKKEIGNGVTVTVPAQLWKVILVLPSEDAEPSRNTQTIAVIMPNDQNVDFDWHKYRVSVAAVEKLTGYTFFPNLPGDVIDAIKDRVDAAAVHLHRSKFGN